MCTNLSLRCLPSSWQLIFTPNSYSTCCIFVDITTAVITLQHQATYTTLLNVSRIRNFPLLLKIKKSTWQKHILLTPMVHISRKLHIYYIKCCKSQPRTHFRGWLFIQRSILYLQRTFSWLRLRTLPSHVNHWQNINIRLPKFRPSYTQPSIHSPRIPLPLNSLSSLFTTAASYAIVITLATWRWTLPLVAHRLPYTTVEIAMAV
jgi:hypothetical protein